MAPSQRNVQLSRKDDFFSDPFFSDILKETDDLFQKRLTSFRDSKSLSLATKQEAAHNLQVSASNDQFLIQLELPGFLPEDFTLKTKDDVIILEANHKASDSNADGSTSRTYKKEFKLPSGVLREQITSSYNSEGVLVISAPRKLEAPEGASISEAMTAASQAFTTDDGTKVAQDSQASSQMIAASTQSDDGSSKSSMTFSSSSQSSSTMTSNTKMGDGGFPSIGMTGMSGMSGMDDMMKDMMGGMSLGGSGDGLSSAMKKSSLMSSSSMMSSSSSMMSSSASSSSTMKSLGSGFDQPSLKMQMPTIPGLNIEELSTAGSDIMTGAPQAYTVTSPPPPPKGEEMNHFVKPSKGFEAKKAADATVLLKLKQGDEYKLVLNMQQYSPENIVVKLNDRELTISAEEGTTERFFQKHIVPEGIDLDQLTSSFSSDGILVIKAPKMK